ncbi:hypothetical protein SELSPUOL_02098 [Selenomonas sputigena ATCC 35185]|uniref:Uncharacterized protein n=1 Tax=Selenomonas sputigena (strain ATCC 35185 / DSM 20758 / CCUG 44933 / VPI D19B-28) TaxID=546271 RepID=C9LX95_SELS3|nr:hypothetical protein SELSPUOL_02098 [Selenomonas sputigena ATCC 35185]
MLVSLPHGAGICRCFSCAFRAKLYAQTSVSWTSCASLHERANPSAPFGLDFLDFHGKLIAEMDLLKFYRRLILLFREYYKGILFLAGNFLQII